MGHFRFHFGFSLRGVAKVLMSEIQAMLQQPYSFTFTSETLTGHADGLVKNNLSTDTFSLDFNHAFKSPFKPFSCLPSTSRPLSTSAILTSSTSISLTPPALPINLSSISKYSTLLLTFLLNTPVGNPGNCPPR